MRKYLIKLSEYIDWTVDKIGSSTSWLTLILMLLICFDVVMRYIWNSSKTWILELEWHLFSVLFLLGASYTLLHDKHVRVDLFYEKLSEKQKNLVNVIGTILFLIPWCLMILNTSWDYAMNSLSFNEKSSQPNGLPARYVIKFFIWIGFALLLIQALSTIIKSIYSGSKSQ